MTRKDASIRRKGLSSELYGEDDVAAFKAIETVRIPAASRVIAIILVLTVIGATAFLYFVPWIQTTSGRGQVTALDPRDRAQDLNALVSGRIQNWYVLDGTPVKAGDAIVQIVDNDPQLVERLNAERAALEQRLRAAEAATRTAALDLERQERLFEQGLASRQDLENAGIRLEDLRVREAEAVAALNRADVNVSRQSLQVVRAPRDGVIVSVATGGTATYVREGDRVATFLPDNVVRAVELMIDGRDISLVGEGDEVRLQFEGRPAVQFSGWPSLSVGTYGGRVAFVNPAADLNGRFRVLVAPDPDAEIPWPDEQFIRFGSQARGWILLGEVNVGYELWRRLNNFPPNLTAPPGDRQGQGNATR